MMRRFFWLLALTGFLGMGILRAEDVLVESQGTGRTYRAAVTEALITALEQQTGMQLSSTQRMSLASSSDSVEVTGETAQDRQELHDSLQAECRKWSEGRIQGYQVLESQQDPATGLYTVVVQVSFPGRYVVGTDPDARRRMAVGSFYRKATTVNVYGTAVETATWAEMFSNALNVQLTQSRKFTMLDRRFESAVQEELRKLSGENAAPGDAVRLCQKLGTDYLVLGTLLFCDVPVPPVNPYTGKAMPVASAPFVDVTYRVILAPTGQLKWSDNIKIDATEFTASSLADFIAQSAESAAARVADSILSAILPFEVVKAYPDGRVIIGEGGKSLQVGEILQVYLLGEEVFDTRTGEVLDVLEEPIGMVLIERVTEKLSYGRLVKGDPAKLTVGARVRRDPSYLLDPGYAPQETAPANPSQVKGGVGGGVVLPF